MKLGRHQEQQHPLEHLQSVEGRRSHVEEDPEQNRLGNELENGGEEDADPDQDEDADVGQALFADSEKLRFLPRRGAVRLPGQTLDMVEGEDGGGDEPGEAQDRVDEDADGDDQQVEVVAAAFLDKQDKIKFTIHRLSSWNMELSRLLSK